MQYIVTDPIASPLSLQDMYTEKLVGSLLVLFTQYIPLCHIASFPRS